MSELDIFLTKPSWQGMVDAVSRILGCNGIAEDAAIGRRFSWRVVCVEVVAIDDPQLEDDQGIPFSTFTIQLQFLLCDRIDHEKEEAFREALGTLVFARLRSELDPHVKLVRNLQREITVK